MRGRRGARHTPDTNKCIIIEYAPIWASKYISISLRYTAILTDFCRIRARAAHVN